MNSADESAWQRRWVNRILGDRRQAAGQGSGRSLPTVLLALMTALPPSSAVATPPLPAGATATRVELKSLPGFAMDAHAAAWQTFLASCRAAEGRKAPLRAGLAPPAALDTLCRDALAIGDADDATARRFFEERFDAFRIAGESGRAFYTGYYEPEVAASLNREGAYQTPILARPSDLVTFAQGETPQGFEGFAAARRMADGTLAVFPDRAAIEDGALAGQGLETAYVGDPVDLFFLQVQGSGRLRLPDGRTVRVAYAGRNGHPYTAIGRVAADMAGIPRSEMTMQRLRAFLAEDAQRARAVMRENRSYVFFRRADELDPTLGPIGGEGVPLTPGRSIAIDRTLWPYGLPVFVSAELPTGPDGALEPFRRLMIAQDTGSAIVGPARADIFFGPGDAAGEIAGRVRHPGDFVVLWPKAQP